MIINMIKLCAYTLAIGLTFVGAFAILFNVFINI